MFRILLVGQKPSPFGGGLFNRAMGDVNRSRGLVPSGAKNTGTDLVYFMLVHMLGMRARSSTVAGLVICL